MKGKDKKQEKLRSAARAPLQDSKFFSRVLHKLEELGLVGEHQNALVIFLAGVTKVFKKPVSVLVKGNSSSGKSNLLRLVCQLFPTESVLKRASLTDKAPAYGEGTLAGKILYLFEYRGGKGNGKDAMYLTRLQQSEGEIAHEFTTASAKRRTTAVAVREGSPVVLTSTTEKNVFMDDETRFLSIRADDSSELTRQIVIQQFVPMQLKTSEPSTATWREAIWILTEKSPVFVHPSWLKAVAAQIPVDDTRARRDSARFRTLLEAVALVASYSDGRRERDAERLEIQFADYCVAYEILNEAFSSTYRGVQPQALRVAEAVNELHKERKRSVKVQEIAELLDWEHQVTYKWVKAAVNQRLILLEPGTHEKNVKRYTPARLKATRFLPSPQSILNECAELPDSVIYADPVTGQQRKLRRGATGSKKSEQAAD
jgi:hypothetical protein